jgi:subtilisin family serine protease
MRKAWGTQFRTMEALECRRMMSIAVDAGIDNISWRGASLRAVSNEYIVNLKRDASYFDAEGRFFDGFKRLSKEDGVQGRAKSVLDAWRGSEFIQYLGDDTVFSIKAPAGLTPDQVETLLLKNPLVAGVTPNLITQIQLTQPNDALYGSQGWHGRNDEPSSNQSGTTPQTGAWDYTVGNHSTIVAVLDSGVNYNHQDLADNRWTDGNGSFGFDAVDNDNFPLDVHGHGTAVAGIISARGNNGFGVAGVNWQTRILPVRIVDASGSGNVADYVEGLNYVRDQRAAGLNVRVLNASAGFEGSGAGTVSAMQTAINDLASWGVLCVFSAGNGAADSSNDTPTGRVGDDLDSTTIYSFPAEMAPTNGQPDNVIAVASVNGSDALSTFSNFGDQTVDIAAPGENIFTTIYDPTNPTNNALYGASSNFGGSGSKAVSGTSFAAPMVAGVAALAFARRPDMTVTQVRNAIIQNDDNIANLNGKVASGGVLNAYKAIKNVVDNYSFFTKVVLGDHEGYQVADQFAVIVDPGNSSNTLVQKLVNGSWGTVTSLPNNNTRSVAIFGLGGNDIINVGNGVYTELYAAGGDGNDVIEGSESDDTLIGDFGNDSISGDSGNDTIDGSAGGDTISGNDGNDSLMGGKQADSLYGGNGNDWFYTRDTSWVDSLFGGIAGSDSGTDYAQRDNSGSIIDAVSGIEFPNQP